MSAKPFLGRTISELPMALFKPHIYGNGGAVSCNSPDGGGGVLTEDGTIAIEGFCVLQ